MSVSGNTPSLLFYQDFNEQFEGYTQQRALSFIERFGCFIRISMNNLKDIHNIVVFSKLVAALFYQDFNEQFEGYTQRVKSITFSEKSCFIRISMNNLKDIHNIICRFYLAYEVVLSGFQ